MEEKAKEQLKWKFYFLTIILNVIILLAACSVIAFFLAPVPFRYYVPVVLVVIDLVLIAYFVKKYRLTKTWLKEQK